MINIPCNQLIQTISLYLFNVNWVLAYAKFSARYDDTKVNNPRFPDPVKFKAWKIRWMWQQLSASWHKEAPANGGRGELGEFKGRNGQFSGLDTGPGVESE